MISDAMLKKMKRYNDIRAQAESLKREIESYLDNNFGISPYEPYDMNSPCSMYEWGTDYLDIDKIQAVVAFKEDFRKRVGESPDANEIIDYFSGR